MDNSDSPLTSGVDKYSKGMLEMAGWAMRLTVRSGEDGAQLEVSGVPKAGDRVVAEESRSGTLSENPEPDSVADAMVEFRFVAWVKSPTLSIDAKSGELEGTWIRPVVKGSAPEPRVELRIYGSSSNTVEMTFFCKSSLHL